MDKVRWDQLPRPVGFVLAGGATLGALQVGMLSALADAGLAPDLVVGTSVGSLNGAALADAGDVRTAAELLHGVWSGLTTAEVFPGGRLAQSARLLRGMSLYPDHGLRSVVEEVLGPAPMFERLALPLGVVATNVLTGHGEVFDSGELMGPLVASSAIPGVLPTQRIDGVPYWDGGVTANVPLRAALTMGAASLVVLDPGDICHRDVAPIGPAASSIAAMGTAIRQRVLVEAHAVAAEVPVLYVERPCVIGRAPLSFDSTADLLVRGEQAARRFLATAPIPTVGSMTGSPHVHDERGPVLPARFPRRRDLWRGQDGT